jgi:hypothetical protein
MMFASGHQGRREDDCGSGSVHAAGIGCGAIRHDILHFRARVLATRVRPENVICTAREPTTSKSEEKTRHKTRTRLVPDKTGLRGCRRVSTGSEWSLKPRFILAKSAILAQKRRFPAGRNGHSIPPSPQRNAFVWNRLRRQKVRTR